MKPSILVTEIGPDYANDRVRYRVQIGKRVVEARISETTKAVAKPSPEEKIREWFAKKTLPEDGAVIDIPGTDLDYF